jgi:hypothetical protein
VIGSIGGEASKVNTYFNPPNWKADIVAFSNKNFRIWPTGVPIEAYTNGFVKRMRIYIMVEASAPVYNYTYDTLIEYYSQPINALHSQKYGWNVDYCGAVSDLYSDPGSGKFLTGGYVSTNLIWSLVVDVETPTNAPVVWLGPTNLVEAAYFASEPALGYHSTEGWGDNYLYWNSMNRRITHTALVIDWNFKVFGDAPYVPIETNRPAWMP